MDGIVTSMLNFKKELERRGHKVYIFSSGSRSSKRKYARADVFLYDGIRFKPYPQYSSAIFPFHSIAKLSKLDIDLIHAQSPFVMGFNGLLAAKLGKYPLVGTFHTLYNDNSLSDYYPKRFRNFLKKSLWQYIKTFYRQCDASIAPSNQIARMLEKQGIRGVRMVPNSVDSAAFNSRVSGTNAAKMLDLKEREKVILYLGRVSKEKKIGILLRASKALMKKRKDIRLVIGGTGPMLEQNMALAKRLGISDRVTFTGFVKQEMLPSLYAASDLLCLPSTFETQGIVCIEAMAVGKPVVGSNSAVIKGIINPGQNGEMFKRDDYRSCAKEMEKVLNNSKAYKRGALKTASEFSLGKTTDKLLDVYNDLLKGRFTE